MSNVEIVLLVSAVIGFFCGIIDAIRSNWVSLTPIGLAVVCIGIAAYLLL
jgi:hypothetical protein